MVPFIRKSWSPSFYPKCDLVSANPCKVDHCDPSRLCALLRHNENLDMFDISSPLSLEDK